MRYTYFPLVWIFIANISSAQVSECKGNSIRTGIGFGINEGQMESGAGLIYSLGWQMNLGKSNKFRLSSDVISGNFKPFATTDVRNQFYRMSNIGLNLSHDLIKYRKISLLFSAGIFANYSRGLIVPGSSSKVNQKRSKYFNSLYFGASTGIGIRATQKKSRFAFEIKPINVHMGADFFALGYMMVLVDFKIKK